jgi:hypothetical protein
MIGSGALETELFNGNAGSMENFVDGEERRKLGSGFDGTIEVGDGGNVDR